MKRSEYQRIEEGGRVVFKKQWTNPVTGRSEVFTSESELEVKVRCEQLRQARRQHRAGTVTPQETLRIIGARVRPSPTVREVWDEHIATLQSSWKKQADSIFRCRFGELADLRVSELSEKLMGEWEAGQRKGSATRKAVGVKTVENAFDVLAAAVRRRIRVDRTALDLPWGEYCVQRGPRWAQTREACRTPEELRALLDAASVLDRAGPFLRLRVLIMVAFALRNNEGAALGWDDFERLPKGAVKLHIRHQAKPGWRARARAALRGVPGAVPRPLDPPKGPHGGKVAEILAARVVVEELALYQEELDALGLYRPDGPLFPGLRGDWRGLYLIRPVTIRRIVARAGLPTQIGRVWVTHSLRATGATLELAARGGDLVSTAGRTRHADLRALRPYLHTEERGLAGSRIELPEVVAPFLLQAHEADGEEPGVGSSRRTRVDLVAAARRMLAVQGAGRPPEVTEAADRAYRRRYTSEVRKGSAPEERAKSARRSKAAFLANWARIVAEQRALRVEPTEAAAVVEEVQAEEGCGMKKKAKPSGLTCAMQLSEWVAGRSKCPNVHGECCPDFSCCRPELRAPREARERFAAASEEERGGMLFGFLGGLVEAVAPGKRVHIVGPR